MVNTSDVHTYQLRHLYASLGVLVKAEPKALQALMGHAKIKTTMDIYADCQIEAQRETAEVIDEFITNLTIEGTNEDMETLLQNIQQIDLTKLEEKKVKVLKQELIRLVNIPKLEEQVKDIILKLSDAEPDEEASAPEYIQSNLKLINTLLNDLELFKIQTRNIKRNSGYNKDYDYSFKYIQTTQKLLQTMQRAINK